MFPSKLKRVVVATRRAWSQKPTFSRFSSNSHADLKLEDGTRTPLPDDYRTPATSDGIPRINLNPNRVVERWLQFNVRSDDIFIISPMKAGTTWMQNIVGNLLFQDEEPPKPFFELSRWLEFRMTPWEMILPGLEAQTNRRFIKSHSPLDVIPFYHQCKYIYLGRDFRDITMSMWNHYSHMTDKAYESDKKRAKTEEDRLPRCPDYILDFIGPFLSRGRVEGEPDGYPFWSNCQQLQSWFDFQHFKNIYFVHYNDLLADLGREMMKVAKFCEIPIKSEESFGRAVEKCTFLSMKANAAARHDLEERIAGGGNTLINKGTNKRWEGVFTEEEHGMYEKLMTEHLSAEAREWVERN